MGLYSVADKNKWWWNMPYGKTRRLTLLASLYELDDALYVNKKYQPQTKYDNDLKYLLKKGYLSYGGKESSWGNGWTSRCTNRFLVLNRKKYEKNILKLK